MVNNISVILKWVLRRLISTGREPFVSLEIFGTMRVL
jgi:hypothetical protein